MSFKPVRLKKDLDNVQSALVRFYTTRPDEYGLLERSQGAYEKYASGVNRFVPEKEKILLDVGSGTWRIPDTIAAYGYKKVIGLDYFSDEKLRLYANNLVNKNAELVTYTDGKIPFPDNTFDAVSSLCVIEHLVYPEKTLNEMHRVLKQGGKLIIDCPNWSGINVPIMAMKHILLKRKRFWLFYSFIDSFSGLFRSITWWAEAFFTKNPKFLLIYPRMKDGEIDFEQSDDDAVHLCQPISSKRYLKSKNYKLVAFNRSAGDTTYSRIFNRIFPSMATTNFIVAEKR
jgi:SAM-dependent methyltransferase